MKKFKVKNDKVKGKKDIDEKDLSKLINILNLEDFAIKAHKRLVNTTIILSGDNDDVDPQLLMNVLAKFPGLYSWAMVENILIKNIYEKKVTSFEDMAKIWFNEYSEKPENSKATQKAIDAQIYKEHKEVVDYNKSVLRELKYKLEISNAMAKVWSVAITSLQSVNKRICADMELTKMNVILKHQ